MHQRSIGTPGYAARLAARSDAPAVWSGLGNAAYGFGPGNVADPAALDTLLAVHGGFDLLLTFNAEFSALLDAAAAARLLPGYDPGSDLEPAQLWLWALVADFGVSAAIPDLDWSGLSGGEPHWDHAQYVTAAFFVRRLQRASLARLTA